jgi:hypothetical protein
LAAATKFSTITFDFSTPAVSPKEQTHGETTL